MSRRAHKIVDAILEAGIDPGQYPDWVHPEKHTKIGARSHPLGNNPAFPQWTPPQGSRSSHWEELVSSEQYQATLKRLSDFINRSKPEAQRRPLRREDLGTVFNALMSSVRTAAEIEQPHKNKLVKMAIDLIFEQPEFRKLKEPYQNGEFRIDAALGAADLSGAQMSTDQPEEAEEEQDLSDLEGDYSEEAVEQEEQAAEVLADITPEIAKRKFINALIHGGAVSKNYAYQLITTEIQAINPNLTTLYGIAMAGSELGYFAMPDSAAASALENPEQQGGSTEVEFDENEVPVVKARGLIFPMLVQELTKGLLELLAYEGLPSDPKVAQEVIDKSDFVDEESWAMIMGRGLWMRFVNALGGDSDEITMHLYNKIVSMPVDEFNKTMQAIQGGGQPATDVVKRLAQQVRADIESGERANEPTYNPDDEPEEEEGNESWR